MPDYLGYIFIKLDVMCQLFIELASGIYITYNNPSFYLLAVISIT